MTKSFEDQLSRVKLMASGEATWDLSPNDQAALRAVLDELDWLRIQKNAAENRIDSMERELGMLKAENEYLKNKPGVR